MSDRQKVNLVPAYLLHARPYRDSSVIADFFTPDYGRTALVARGVRSPKSKNRGLLRPFRKLLISWVSRGSLGTLTQIEADQSAEMNFGKRLLSAFYTNELLIRALKPGDSHSDLFYHYESCLNNLMGETSESQILRLFERDLLDYLGYGLPLDSDSDGSPLEPQAQYSFSKERGFSKVPVPQSYHVSGHALLALAKAELSDEKVLAELKILLRWAIDLQLGSSISRVREVSRSMHLRQRSWDSVVKPKEGEHE